MRVSVVRVRHGYTDDHARFFDPLSLRQHAPCVHSVALTLGCNPKWIAEQIATSLAMIQQNYGKYIRDDGDAVLWAYLERPETN
jgi:hypothetical protein